MCTDNDAPSKWMHVNRQLVFNKAKNIGTTKRIILLCNAVINDLYRQSGMKSVSQAYVQNNFQEQKVLENFNKVSFRYISGHPIRNHKLSKKENLILWAGNLGYNKRPEFFIELARQMQNSKFQFIMMGSHDDINRMRVVFYNLPDNLKFLGKIPFEETQSWFSKAFLLVNTSVKEGFPNTFIQAWLNKVPVVTLGVDPNNTIKNNHIGMVATSISELVDIIKKLEIESELYSKMAEDSFNYAKNNHSIEKSLTHFLGTL
jgi:glycosyltransferase involved in cell wall biosynthesis